MAQINNNGLKFIRSYENYISKLFNRLVLAGQKPCRNGQLQILGHSE